MIQRKNKITRKARKKQYETGKEKRIAINAMLVHGCSCELTIAWSKLCT